MQTNRTYFILLLGLFTVAVATHWGFWSAVSVIGASALVLIDCSHVFIKHLRAVRHG